jgi:putative oxidoreductase
MANKITSYKSTLIFNSGVVLLILRVVAAGFLITFHGFPKWWSIGHGQFHFLNPIGIGVKPSLILAACAEGIASFFVLIGLYARIASIIVIIDLLVAFFTNFNIAHLDQLALLYMLIFFAVAVLGPGKLSIDGLRRKSRRSY